MKKMSFFVLSGLLLSALTLSPVKGLAAEKTLNLASWGPDKHYAAVLRAEWIAKVNEALAKEYKIVEHPGGKLYGPKDVQGAVAKGIVDMGLVLQSRLVAMVPMLQGAYLPFGFETLEDNAKAYAGESGEILSKALEQKGLKLLWTTFLDPVHLFSSKRNYQSVEELKGLRILTVSPMASEIFSNLGCSPDSSIPQTGQHMALKRGISDATLTTTVFGYFQKTFEVTPYITKINFSFPALYIMMNAKNWKKLPSRARDLMMRLGQAYSAKTLEMADAWSKKFAGELAQKGVTIIDFPAGERAKIVGVAKKSWAKWAAANGPDAQRLYRLNLE